MKYLLLVLLIATEQLMADKGLPVIQVASGIYVHYGVHELPDNKNKGAIANIGFIVGKSCVAVIDTGGNPQQGAALKETVEKTTSVPICYVINTHVHPDHIYGNKAFKQAGIKFIGHHKLARAMAMRGAYYIEKAADQLAVKLTAKDIIAPEITVKNFLKLDLGGRVLFLTAHPTAHTDNDLTIYDQQTDSLWLSDLLFIEHIPVVDGSLKGWIKELEKLKKRKVKRVIPGHGPLIKNWPVALEPELSYLKMLLKEIRIMLKKGEDMQTAMNRVGLTAKGQWKLFAQFHKKNIATAYAELEWED